jgi:L-ascorbate metabolism protein UlaG (beta-lactamase superfamily)
MHKSHVNPQEAVAAFHELGGKHFIPMHYGTFDLSDEPPSEPLRRLKQEAANAGLLETLRPLAINENIDIGEK